MESYSAVYGFISLVVIVLIIIYAVIFFLLPIYVYQIRNRMNDLIKIMEKNNTNLLNIFDAIGKTNGNIVNLLHTYKTQHGMIKNP